MLLLGILPIFIALFIYSQTWAYIWDEGFHLVAARLIASGKRPYIDFCFPQTPLNAYINAALLLLFGNNWRPIHLVAAAYICIAVWLVADFVQSRLPFDRWKLPCALAAAGLFGLNLIVVQFGPCAQAYAIGMLGGCAAFRLALPAVSSRSPWFAFLSGMLACAAAASTLLTAPVPLVLLLWFLFFNQQGSRWIKTAAYLIGCAVPFAPVLWLFSIGPKQTLFNVVQYQAIFRRVNWGDATMHDVDALSDWLNSPQALLYVILMAAALLYLWHERRHLAQNALQPQREFLLAAALAGALSAFISTAHPTFERYYVVATPFLAMVGGFGLYAIGSRLTTPRHAWSVCGVIIGLWYCMFFRGLFDQREDAHWSTYETVARSVTEIAPMGTTLYADEMIYFLLQRDPPEGMEFSYSHKLDLPPDQEKLFHIISNKKLKQQIHAGRFQTFEACGDAAMDDLEPAPDYRQHTEPEDCNLFWQPKASTSKR